jgi:hypothetical protein
MNTYLAIQTLDDGIRTNRRLRKELGDLAARIRYDLSLAINRIPGGGGKQRIEPFCWWAPPEDIPGEHQIGQLKTSF